jgi:hypothetical protein
MKNCYAVAQALTCGFLASGLLASPTRSSAEEAPVPATITVPFTKLLCLANFAFDCISSVGGNNTPVLPGFFTVPSLTASGKAVNQLVVDFVSGSCVGTGRTTEVLISGALGTPQVADSGDNFTVNTIPMAVAQFNDILGQNAVQAFAQQTRLVYSPATKISMLFDFAKGGATACKLQLNGHFEVSQGTKSH